jgi:menaquinone-dependent protoporphyrinogen oxidase
MIRFIMWMTKGPTDPTGKFDFTDWNEVEKFGGKIAGLCDVAAS